MAIVLIVFMIVSAILAHTYVGGNHKVYNIENSSEESQNDGQEEEVTEGNNFVYDILDEMLEEIEKEEGERIKRTWRMRESACNASSLSASRKIIVPRTHYIVFNN